MDARSSSNVQCSHAHHTDTTAPLQECSGFERRRATPQVPAPSHHAHLPTEPQITHPRSVGNRATEGSGQPAPIYIVSRYPLPGSEAHPQRPQQLRRLHYTHTRDSSEDGGAAAHASGMPERITDTPRPSESRTSPPRTGNVPAPHPQSPQDPHRLDVPLPTPHLRPLHPRK
ncbi:hypothetical protein C8J57DRAFT_1337670 [Mycena rebaudengoi]|nr:hypothetical protein C8J57DRAFT_1337670 [Mycena rebaudengoi]